MTRKLRPILPFALALAGLVVGALAPTRGALEDAVGQEAGGVIHFVLLEVEPEEGGTMRCALYRGAEGFLDRNRAYKKTSVRVRGNRVVCTFRQVPPGTYAMAALHDADRDREMDETLIGLPDEGYAISRDARDRMSRPEFAEAAVRFRGGEARFTAHMRY